MQIIREELPEEKKSPVEMHWKKPPIIKPDIPKPVECDPKDPNAPCYIPPKWDPFLLLLYYYWGTLQLLGLV